MNPSDLLKIYRYLRSEGCNYSETLTELRFYYGKDESVIIKYLLIAQEAERKEK